VFIVRNAPNMDTNIDMMSKLRLLEKINLNKSQKIEYTRCYVLYCGSAGQATCGEDVRSSAGVACSEEQYCT